ncbi:MAG: hypothetical protein WBC85_09225, partial [Planktotalea sp.]|uniref:hypothetical protein n=1 Tax=Planktotalea sp. TaxID=2029877 RepID=UPI003C78B405
MSEEKPFSNFLKAENLKSEALLLGLLSVSIYIFSYSSQRAYLKHFGVDEIFVIVDLPSLVRSGIWILGYGFVLYHLLQLPTKFYSSILRLILVFRGPIMFLALFILIYYFSGFNWLSIFVLFIVAALTMLYFSDVVRAIRDRDGYKKFIDDQLEVERQDLDGRLQHHFRKPSEVGLWDIAFVILLLPYALGIIVGG